jgi:hypothetical protein
MTLKFRFLSLITTLAVVGSCFASGGKNAPSSCPSVSAIQSEQVSMALRLTPNTYFAFHQSDYNTDKTWYFAIGFFEVDTEEAAITGGNSALKNLSGYPHPFFDGEEYWVCHYNAGPDLAAIAFYSDMVHTPLQAKQFLHRLS